MSFSTQWWIICGILVAVELATGTFYLLMLALGAAAAAVMAMLGFEPTAQVLVAAVVGGGAVALWHMKRIKTGGTKTPAGSNPDANLDIGQEVQVKHWQADGSATVRYRGAEWSARFAGQGTPEAGKFTIRAIEGSCLQLDN
ncbi:MAG TPA: NfeD family protein [Burkholderiaceae bacterium]|jgi:membrane protein implicated in regulation of membrane protease activity